MGDKKIKGVIFDKDGTLFNYAAVWGPVAGRAADMILRTFNIASSKREEVKTELFRILGIDDEGHTYPDGILFNHERRVAAFFKLLSYCLKHRINPYTFKKILFSFLKDPAEGIVHELERMDFSSVQSLFCKLESHGIKIAVVTNDTTVSAKTCLKYMGIDSRISFLRTKESNCRRKPDAEAIRQFCAHFGFSPDEVAVVGDTVADMKFAANGNAAYKIALLSGSGDEETLSSMSDQVYPDITYLENDKKLFPEV